MKLRRFLRRKTVKLFLFGLLLGLALAVATALGSSWSSTSSFCMSCHEMRVVGEQGWMHSRHYENPSGVVAGCSDCHIPPALVPKLWTKTRDGAKDIAVHFFGESDPAKMDWDALAASARAKIHDSACRRCHGNLTPRGAALKTILAHRENQRLDEPKHCLACHLDEFHGRFRTLLNTASSAAE